jgi:hypothetical protein
MTKDKKNNQTKAIQPSPKAVSKTDDLSTRLAQTMESLNDLEAEAELLERELPPLQAKLFAAQEAIVKEVVESRKSLVLLVRRLVESSPRRGVLRREGPDLIWHIVRDLEDRFGVDVRGLLPDLPSPDEDEDDGDDCAWASSGSERSHEPPPKNAPKNPLKPRSAVVDPQEAAKGIYRSLARELHPDKTRDEEERLRRTDLMQRITRAWQDRDLGALLKLLHAHGSDDARAQAMDESTLQACLQGLEQTLADLQRRVKNLRHGNTFAGVKDWLIILIDQKLQDKLLRRVKSGPREELEAMRRLFSLWSYPGGLEQFLRETDPEDWEGIV